MEVFPLHVESFIGGSEMVDPRVIVASKYSAKTVVSLYCIPLQKNGTGHH